MKISVFFKALALALVAFTLSYLCYSHSELREQGIFEKHFEQWTLKAQYKTYDKAISFKGVEEVVIYDRNSNLELKPAADDLGKASFTTAIGHENKMQVTRQGEHKIIIHIQDMQPYDFTSLSLKLPVSVKKIEVNAAVAGDINIDGLKLERLVLRSPHADLKVKDVSIQESKVELTNGDVVMEGELSKLDLKSVNGDIAIKTLVVTPAFQITTVSGDVFLTLPRVAKTKLSLHSVNGEVHAGPFKIEGPSASSFVTVNTVNGDVILSSE